jgi:hypothetical protein
VADLMLPKTWGLKNLVYMLVRVQVGASAVQDVRKQERALPDQPVAQYLLPNTQSARRVYGQCRRSSNSPGCTFRVPAANFTSRRPLLGVENLISAIIFALNNPVTIGEPHVVQHFQLMTIGEILTMLRKMQGRSLSTVFSYFC